MTITRAILYVGTSVVLLGAGFCWGNYHGNKSAAYISNAATLVWLTGIDMALEKGNITDARQKTEEAIDGHVGVLSGLGKNRYLQFLVSNSPWMEANNNSIADAILRRTERSFSKMPNGLRPETKEYLSHYDVGK